MRGKSCRSISLLWRRSNCECCMCSLFSRTIAAEWCTLMSPRTPRLYGLHSKSSKRFQRTRHHVTWWQDRDGVYGHHFIARVEGLGVEDIPISARSPWQNCYAEGVIGSIRRECLDHVVVINERHLRRILKSYFQYYHRSRTHLALQKDAPQRRPVHDRS